MQERIQKILSARGVASRRQAEQMIQQGRVRCNGRVCVLGDTCDAETEEITVDGIVIPSPETPVYLLLHKPKGYVTTLSDERGRKNAAQLVTDCGKRVYPVGRLDMDSEGLLLFTNDGAMANKLMHPSHQVNKVYQVWVKGYTQEAVQKLKKPIVLDGYRIAPPEIQVIQTQQDQAVLCITIHEGRNRQVRRMCARAGMAVKRLIRIQEGTLCLGELAPGQWRYLTQEEVEALK